MRKPDLARLLFRLRHPGLDPLFDIPTHLTSREKVALHDLAVAIARDASRPVRLLEIGSYVGASASFLAAGLGDADGEIVCIDTWSNDAMSEGQRDTRAEFAANTRRAAPRIVPLRGWSHDPAVIAGARERGPVDLLFIDGDHSHEGALADWRNYGPLLRPGGIVVMHDIGWAEGVQRVVAEEIRPRSRRERRLPNLWWARLDG
jgi:predicted O-methyltransferase YrrM